jgi:hypothetical protein
MLQFSENNDNKMIKLSGLSIHAIYIHEENKSNNFFVGKQKIKLVNYTFCFTNFISHGTKILKIIVNNGQKSLKGLKASRKNKFIIFLKYR